MAQFHDHIRPVERLPGNQACENNNDDRYTHKLGIVIFFISQNGESPI
jgi:hypothetical protein